MAISVFSSCQENSLLSPPTNLTPIFASLLFTHFRLLSENPHRKQDVSVLKSRVFVCPSVCLSVSWMHCPSEYMALKPTKNADFQITCSFNTDKALPFRKKFLNQSKTLPFSIHGSCHYNHPTACRVLVLMTCSNPIKSQEALWGSSLASFPHSQYQKMFLFK